MLLPAETRSDRLVTEVCNEQIKLCHKILMQSLAYLNLESLSSLVLCLVYQILVFSFVRHVHYFYIKHLTRHLDIFNDRTQHIVNVNIYNSRVHDITMIAGASKY
jgi:hypothetical protein